MPNELRDFSAVERRINYLRQEIYTYDRYFRNPTRDDDATGQVKQAIDAQGNQEELEQLMYLRDLAEKANKSTSIKTWQIVLVAFYSTAALVIAGLSLWMTVLR